MLGQRAAYVLKHPGVFAIQVLKSFRANQGLLLAGALAYYVLLSIVPLLILTVIALSHVIDQTKLLQTLGRYLPGPAHDPQQNHLLAALSPLERERLYPHLRLVPMPLGEVLYESGDVLRHNFFSDRLHRIPAVRAGRWRVGGNLSGRQRKPHRHRAVHGR
jgi:hypothetical protein